MHHVLLYIIHVATNYITCYNVTHILAFLDMQDAIEKLLIWMTDFGMMGFMSLLDSPWGFDWTSCVQLGKVLYM
jgi:hypothetical protein